MQSDLAIIVVKDVIEFSNSVHAACVDLDKLFAAVQLSHGKIGKVGQSNLPLRENLICSLIK